MIDLAIPEIHGKKRTVKDHIFSILTQEKELTLRQLHNKIKKQHNVNTTYQGVRKAVDNLTKKEVLIKKDKTYSISKKWVLSLKSFFDDLLLNFENKTTSKKISADLSKGDYAVYTFDSLYTSSVFWGETISFWLNNLKAPEKCRYLSYAHYPWWLLFNLGSESNVMDKFKRSKIKSEFIFFSNHPLTKWAVKVYSQLGIKASIKKNKYSKEDVGINILEDYIIEIKYPKETIKIIKALFKKYKNTQEVSTQEITSLVHKKCDIKITIFKNREIANMMHNQITSK